MVAPQRDGQFLGELLLAHDEAWIWVGTHWEEALREQTRMPQEEAESVSSIEPEVNEN